MGEDGDTTSAFQLRKRCRANRIIGRRIGNKGRRRPNGTEYAIVLRECRRVPASRVGYVLQPTTILRVDDPQYGWRGPSRWNDYGIVRGGYVEAAVPRVIPNLIASADIPDNVEHGAGERIYNDGLAARGYQQVLERTECCTVSACTGASGQCRTGE